VRDGGRLRYVGRALNEFVVFRKNVRMLNLDIALQTASFHFRADGIVISTPTGSTAHAFAAGGPIVSPESSALVVVALAPFAATWRNCMYDGEEISLKAASESEIMLDGQEVAALAPGSEFVVRRSREKFNLLVPESWNFWQTLKDKFSWGKGLF